MKYQVRLNCPASMWALVEVEAASEDEAKSKALQANAEGGTGDLPPVSWEYGGFDVDEAEVVDVEELVPAPESASDEVSGGGDE